MGNMKFDGADVTFELDGYDALVERVRSKKVDCKINPSDLPRLYAVMDAELEGNEELAAAFAEAQEAAFGEAVLTAEAELEGKRQELLGLSSTDIRIATFTNVSRTVLPRVIRDFGTLHPGVRFTLKQGDYTRNAQWVHDGVVDFCFTARGFTAGLEKRVVYHDELVALLPAAHPLAAKEKVTLADLASEPFVLLDEGEQSLVLDAFATHGLSPHVTSEVTDDYTIMAMVEEGLGVSMLYRRTVEGMRADIRVRPIVHAPSRDVVAAWRSWDTMPIATRRFIDYMSSHIVN